MNASKTNRIIIRNDGWGNVLIENVLAVLTSSIELFEKNILIENFNQKMVVVQHASYHIPPIHYPKMYRSNPNNLIFLDVQNHFWSKYAYQFAHEYCHHQIESEFISTYDQFGWFEESLCELASIHSIKHMAGIWKTKPPYSNWSNYSMALDEYADDIINRETNIIECPLSKWLNLNIDQLSRNRYLREKNCLVAANILDFFISDPTLWNTIPFIKKVELLESMEFDQFVNEWGKLISDSNKESWSKLKERLLN